MGKARYRCPYLNNPKQWYIEVNVDQKPFNWIYPDYKCRRLSIMLRSDGRYIPLVNGSNDFRNVPFGEIFTLDSLEESKKFLFTYIDAVIDRDKRQDKAQLAEYLKAHVERKMQE